MNMPSTRTLFKLPLAALFFTSGVGHFLLTPTFLRMMPPELPWHRPLVYLSGAIELVLAALLFFPRWERFAAWGLIATLVAVFPANLHMYRTAGTAAAVLPSVTPRMAAARLPLQAVLIAWAYFLAVTAGATTAPLETAANVDLSRYMGDWYELAHMPNYPQRGCTDTVVRYTLNESGGFDLANACWKGDKHKLYSGVARRVESGSSAKFRVKFFLFLGGDYWITQLDPEYRWAVVGAPKRDQLWVIGREPAMDESLYQRLLARAREQGFDTSKLERTKLTGKPPKF